MHNFAVLNIDSMEKYLKEKSKDYSLLDNHTGEIIEFYQTKKVSIDEFIMVFFSNYPQMMKLKGVCLKVLMCCWKFSSYNAEYEEEGNIVHNNARFKEYCRQDGLEAPDASIDNAISHLCKVGLLIKKCRGEYLLDPRYFFKGKLSKRSKIMYNIVVEPSSSEEINNYE